MSVQRRFVALVAVSTLSLSATAAWAAASGPLDPTTTTTTTTATSSTTTTTTASSTTTTTEGGGSSSSTSSTNPPPLGGITQVTQPSTTTTTNGNGNGNGNGQGSGGGDSSSTSTTSPDASGDGDGAHVPRGEIPPGAQDVINSVVRSPGNSSAKLLAALQPLIDMGVPADQVYAIGMGRFPVAGLANFADDWLYPRWDGTFHFHHGTDVFAVGGLPVRSPTDGVLRQDSDNLGGTVVYVKQADGTYFYMAHLSGYVEGQVTGQVVRTGEIVGYVGNSGDAAGGPTHVHFEVHPNGGEAVDPKPYLDQWVADAIANAPHLIASVRAAKFPNLAPVLRPPALEAEAFDAPAVPAPSQLLWASSANPQGGALQLAEAVASEAARTVDWSAEARRARQDELVALHTREALMPLVPAYLQSVLDPVPLQITLVDHR